MTNPKRYEPEIGEATDGDPIVDMAEYELGDYVKWEDYEVLRGNLSLAEEGLAAATQEIKDLQQFEEWAEPQIVTHGQDMLEIERLRGALEDCMVAALSPDSKEPPCKVCDSIGEIASKALGGSSEPVPAPEASILKAFARSPRRIEPNDRRGHADWCPAAGSADAGDPRCTCIKPVAVSGIKVVVDPTMPPDEMMMRNSLGQEVRVTGIGAGIPPDGAPSMPSGPASARVVPAICGKPMPNGKGTGQCINVPGHEGDCDDMPF